MGFQVLYDCSVCEGQYSTRQEWLGHLLEPGHQNLARQELIDSWHGKARKRTLVLFSKSRQHVAKDTRILQYFSKDFDKIVTDFVWWSERPLVGFMQFDSIKTVKEVLSSIRNGEVVLGDQILQVKDADTIPDFEWDALVPVLDARESNHDSSDDNLEPSESGGNSSSLPRIKTERRKRRRLLSQSDNLSVSSMSLNATDDTTQPQNEANDSIPSLVSPSGNSTTNYFSQHLERIKELMKIPDMEYDSVMRLLPLLQELFSENATVGSGNQVTITPIISRYFPLKLKYFEKAPPPLILLERKSELLTKNSFVLMELPCAAIDTQFRDQEKWNKFFSSVKRLFPPDGLNVRNASYMKDQRNLLFSLKSLDGTMHPPIWLTGRKALNVEFQMWRLITYLCTFDPRCELIRTIVYYWARTNSIQISGTTTETENCISRIPDPFGITWLLILFLCKKRLIPTPQLIKSRSKGHVDVIKFSSDVYIGFFDDPEFAKSWLSEKNAVWKNSEDFARDVLTITAEFFLFYGRRLAKDSWVISSLNGAVCKMKDMQGRNYEGEKILQIPQIAINHFLKKLSTGKYRIHLTNPFNNEWKISLSNSEKPYEAMVKTGEKLIHFLQSCDGGEVSVDTEEFLKLFKVTED